MAPTTCSPEKLKPTSCEGYVTKRGHYVKSWRVRYLVLSGSDLKIAYYDSKDAYHNKAEAKGWFYLSSIEKHDYNIGLVANEPKPFGFKMVGHAPTQGYVELDVYVDCLQDLMKWMEVAQNALEAAKRLVAPIPTVSQATKSRLLHDSTAAVTTQQQVQKCHETKEQLLKSALKDIQAAKAVGSEACSEIVQQGETLDRVEKNLDAVASDLDFADTLLKKMKHPMLHMFTTEKRSPTHRSAEGSTSSPFPPPKAPQDQHEEKASTAATTTSVALDDLELLSQALDELEHQATAFNTQAVKSTEQVTRIEQKISIVTDRVQTQTTKADRIRQAGRLF